MAAGDDIAIGEQGFTEQPEEFVERDGLTTRVRVWKGPRATVDDKVAELRAEHTPDEIEVNRAPLATIRLYIGGDGIDTGGGLDPEDSANWELIGQDLDKPLETHPYYRISDGASLPAIEEANKAIRKGTAGTVAWDTLHPGFNLQHFVDLRLRGIDTYITFSYIVRKTITVSSAHQYKAEFVGKKNIPGRDISWSDIEVPARAKFEQPTIRFWDGPNSLAWKDKKLNAWLVKSPAVTWQKRPKAWRIVREYWGAEGWAMHIYEGGLWLPTA